MALFPLNDFSIRYEFPHPSEVPSLGTAVFCRGSGEEGTFHHSKWIYSIYSFFYQLNSILFCTQSPSVYKPLQGAKETVLMTLTSEDAPSMIKEIQLLKHVPTIQSLCC